MNTRLKKYKVLVVDDDQDMQIFISTLLNEGGFKAIPVGDTEEGFIKAQEFDPALIILNVPMPKKKGVHLYNSLKQNDKLKKIPVIIISTLDKKTLLEYHRPLNFSGTKEIVEADAYLHKPLEADDLLRVVQDIIERSKKAKKNEF